MAHVCYLLRAKNAVLTYIGVTSDLVRRLRQHNGEIRGGAKYTIRHAAGWEVMLVIGGFESRKEALKFEWAAKRAPNRRTVISGMRARANRMCELAIQNPSLRAIECNCIHFLTGLHVMWVRRKEKSLEPPKVEENED